MILALATMGVQAGLRFELQPGGEVRLQQLGNDILSGMLGLAVHADQPISLGGGTSLYVDRIDADRQRLLDVILETGNATFYARSADAAYVSEGFVRFRLEHVTAVYPQASGRARSGTFAAIDFVTPMHSSAPITGPARFETKQRGLAGLIAMHRDRNAAARAAADKAIAERASYVLAACFSPGWRSHLEHRPCAARRASDRRRLHRDRPVHQIGQPCRIRPADLAFCRSGGEPRIMGDGALYPVRL